jgi:CHAT domain-containing protein
MLHALPFQALPWDKEFDFLIQKFAITYVPNMTCIPIRYSLTAKPRLLALGVNESHVPDNKYIPLVEAETEVATIQQTYKRKEIDVTCLVGAQVSETALRQLAQRGELGTFTHLHISTHGDSVNSDNPMESYLVLYDSFLDGLEIANWQLRAELVVLSACCSGQRAIEERQMGGGKSDLPGDDVFGLQAAFFAAGAKRVLGTVWPVQDTLSLKFMVKFYSFLAEGETPELALQKTIVDHLANAKSRLRYPYFWATFFISAVGRPYTSQV